MTSFAIDPAEVPLPPPGPDPRRRHLLLVSGLALGLAVLAAAAAGAYMLMPRFTSLSGLAFLPDFAKPRRGEIKIGALPDMPPIRNGVPEAVGPKGPVRVVGTSPPPAPVQVAPPIELPESRTSSLGSAPVGAVVRTESLADLQPVSPSPAAPPPAPASGPAAAVPIGPILGTAPVPATLQAATPAVPAPATIPAVASAPPPLLAGKPVVAPVEPTRSAAVPLPPAAPDRRAFARAEPRPDRPAQRRVVATAALAASPPPPQPHQAPPDDDVDLLGFKFPSIASTGRRIREAAEAIGDAVTGGRL